MGVKFTSDQLKIKGISVDGNEANFEKRNTTKHPASYPIKEPNVFFPGIFIPGEVYSSKNSKDIKWVNRKKEDQIKTGKKKRPIITNSDAVLRYKGETAKYFDMYRNAFLTLIKGITPPYHIGFMFYRKIDNVWDYNNINQVIQDMMVEHDWLSDDDRKTLVPHPMGWRKKPENPGVWIIPMCF